MAEERVSFLKQDVTEKVVEDICDNICRFANDYKLTQEQLDVLCDNCIINKIRKVEMI